MAVGWDVVVVGAGAAGLLAAIRAAERGRRTLVLEKNARPGVKILLSGGTRCNLTHAADPRAIAEAFGRQGRFLHSALAAFGPQQAIALVESEGMATKVETGGKVFPASDRAADVLEAILRRARRSGAHIALQEPLLRLERGPDAFRLTTSLRQLVAGSVILATGGMSYPRCGTTGDGYGWAAELGHRIVTPRPALTPILTDRTWTEDLQGVSLPDVLVRVVAPRGGQVPGPGAGRAPDKGSAGKPLAWSRGSLLFTHFGLSGPVVLNVSRAVSGCDRPETLQLLCDLLPGTSQASLESWLRESRSRDGAKQLGTILAERLPRRLGQALAEAAGVGAERRAAEAGKQELRSLAECVKRLCVPVRGVMGFRKAEVTAGGVCLDDVDSRSMQSKRVPRLYFAGEILDLDGPIGGYNFQAAFSTGWQAGQSA